MTRDPYPMKYMLAFDFADGSVFVGETSDPKLYVRTIMREWRSEERPVVRVVSRFCDVVNDGRGYDIHAKYVARYRAMIAGKVMRARGVGAGGSPRSYASSAIEFHPDVIDAAGSIAWGCGDLLMIDGLTSITAKARPIGWALVAGGVGLIAGAFVLRRHMAISGASRTGKRYTS